MNDKNCRLLSSLVSNLRTQIRIQELESPSCSFRCKVKSSLKLSKSYKVTLQVISSTVKTKLAKLVVSEEKVKVVAKGLSLVCTVIEVEKDEVVLESPQNVKGYEVEMIVEKSRNDKVVLDKLKVLQEKNAEIQENILHAWIFKPQKLSSKRSCDDIEQEIHIEKYSMDGQRERCTENSIRELSIKTKTKTLEQPLSTCYNNDKYGHFDPKSLNGEVKIESTNFIFPNEEIRMRSQNYELKNKEGSPVLFDCKLNQSQKEAVFHTFRRSPYKILGPPGSGKTRTVVELICQLLRNNESILVAGPTNISVDNIISRYTSSDFFAKHKTLFYRLGSSFKGLTHMNLENLGNQHVIYMKPEKDDRNFERERNAKRVKFMKNLEATSHVVFATLFSSLKINRMFDWVLIDEACQASAAESFLALSKGKQYILIGDPNQLCPDVPSIYESLNLPTILLNEQYRMSEKLFRFSNETFYESKVVSVPDKDILFFGKSPILFVDTEDFDMEERLGDISKSNTGEAKICKRIVELLGDRQVGIIAPYTSQVLLLREMVDKQVSTVDGFQGQECDYIILTLVRSNREREYGFLSDKKRLNVAITRCRKGLVVVGDSGTFRKSALFKGFFKFLNDFGIAVDPDTLEMFIEEFGGLFA